MKTLHGIVLIAAFSSLSVLAETQTINNEAINVDGYVKEEAAADPELNSIQAEITKQKKEIVLNREKTKVYKQLSQSVDKLSESTEAYLEEKRAAQEEIANYNAKVSCLKAENPGPECDKFIRRK